MSKKKKPRKKVYNPNKLLQGGKQTQSDRQQLASIAQQHQLEFDSRLAGKLAPAQRDSWLLSFAPVKAALKKPQSCQGGVPLQYPDDSWPQCPCCKGAMLQLLQLLPQDQPAPLQAISSNEIIQVFICPDCEPVADPQQQSDSTPVILRYRVFDVDLLTAAKRVPGALSQHVMILKQSQHKTDYPSLVEREVLGLSLQDEDNWLMNQVGYPASGDKLFGWPRWLHGVGWHNCKHCGQILTPVLQMQPHTGLHLNWQSTTGHLLLAVCANHKDEFQLLWQDLDTAMQRAVSALQTPTGQ